MVAWTNVWAADEKEWLTQGAQLQAKHLNDRKVWSLDPLLLTHTLGLEAKWVASLWMEIVFLLSCHKLLEGGELIFPSDYLLLLSSACILLKDPAIIIFCHKDVYHVKIDFWYQEVILEKLQPSLKLNNDYCL